jgi:hypothetical protein
MRRYKPSNGTITTTMTELALLTIPLAAIGYSLVYMLFGGGLFGAVVIFFIAKAFGK